MCGNSSRKIVGRKLREKQIKQTKISLSINLSPSRRRTQFWQQQPKISPSETHRKVFEEFQETVWAQSFSLNMKIENCSFGNSFSKSFSQGQRKTSKNEKTPQLKVLHWKSGIQVWLQKTENFALESNKN